jgi:hypothetical protein
MEKFCGCVAFPKPEQPGFLSSNRALKRGEAEGLELYELPQGFLMRVKGSPVSSRLKLVQHLLDDLQLESDIAYGAVAPALQHARQVP